MEDRSTKRRKLLMVLAAAIAAVVIVSVVLFVFFSGGSNAYLLTVPANHVNVNLGTSYLGMIDVSSVLLGVNGTQVTMTYSLRGAISDLNSSTFAQWNATLVLQNDTDVLKTYQIVVNLNSTGMTSQIQDVDTLAVQNCDAAYHNNVLDGSTLVVKANVNELPATTTIQWGIITSYNQYSGTDLVASASDIAPDQGLQQTVISK